MSDLDYNEITFAEVIAPITPEEFFAEYYDKKPLYIPGTPDKFPGLMPWSDLNAILDMSAIWSSKSLNLVLDRDPVPRSEFCAPAVDRDNRTIMRPLAPRVMELLNKGATLVCNDVDSLTPSFSGVANALEAELFGKTQGNLYCSWKAHQAFHSHFDTHDVFAIQIDGQKHWQIYATRADYPIAHERFKTLGQERHERDKGSVARDIIMNPGDLIYLPRGWYHDALAVTGASLHITFGVTRVIGFDLLNMLLDLSVNESPFRRNLPRPQEGRAALARHLEGLAKHVKEVIQSDAFIDQFDAYQRGFHYRRGGYDLPVTLEEARYRVKQQGFEVAKTGAQWVLSGPSGSVPIPQGMENQVRWIVDRESFTADALDESHPGLQPAVRQRLLDDLTAMRVIERQ